MNRNVMKRQMFAGGGAAFPDLSGDGEITQRDILMGRGVQFMQEGGIASMGVDPMAGAPMAAGPEQIDPQVLEGAMMTASENFGALDDAQNYEEVIDSIRGDALPIEQRYQELAQFVGPQDAQQTPESVLAMVQPVIQMAAVDGGIGGLASNEMNAEVSGPMAEGIMSTIAMEGGEEPPVNFSQGGDARRNTKDVRYYADGGPIQYYQEAGVVSPTAVETEFQNLLPSYMDVAGSDPAAYDKQRNLTQAQILFDISGAALNFAGRGGESLAQALAGAAGDTQLFDKLSARTQSLSDFKTAQDKQDQALKLSVLQSAQGKVDAREIAAAAAAAKPVDDNIFKVMDGTTLIYQGPLTQGKLAEFRKASPNLTVDRVYEDKSKGKNAQNLMFVGADGQKITIAAVPGTDNYNNILEQGAVVVSSVGSDFMTKTKPVTFKMDVTVGDKTYKEGDFANLPQSTLNQLNASSWGDYVAPKFEFKEFKDGDKTTLYQFDSTNPTNPIKIIEGTDPKNYVFQTIKDGDKTHLLRIDRDNPEDKGTIIQTGTDTDKYEFREVKDGFTTKLMRFKKDDPTDTGTTVITATDAPVYRYETITDGGKTKIMRFNNQTPDAKPMEVLSATDTSNPEYMRVTIRNSEGIMIPVTVDVTTEAGQKYLQKANKIILDSKDPTAATVETIPTAKNNAKAYMLGNGDVFMSYDNGRTYLDANGQPQAFKPGDAFEVDNTKTYEIYKREQLNQQMRRELLQGDKKDSVTMTIPVYNNDGSPKLIDGKAVTRQMNASEVNDYLSTLEQVRLGTGTWSKIYAGLDNVLGGVISPKLFNKMFGETQEARQFVRTIRVMGRSALSSSPRFAQRELETVQSLFPSEEQFFKNPESAVDQINLIAQYLRDEKTRLNEDIQTMSDATLRSQSLSKLNEIKKLQSIIGPMALLKNTQFDAEFEGGSVNSDALNNAFKNIAKGANN